jgi:HNH endonuclease
MARRSVWGTHLWAEDEHGCWVWQGARAGAGYGQFGRNTLAHREAYERAHGPIPPDTEVDHTCRNRLCVNPTHLEAVSHSENLLRAVRGTHCNNGHLMDEANTYTYPNGRRRCRTCQRENSATWRHRHPGAPRKGAPRPVPTHCGNGHEYTPENTYTSPRGERICRTCNRERQRRHKSRRGADG